MTTATIDDATIRQMEPSLFRYAMKWVGREDVARDLVQETWAAAVGSADSFAGRSSLRTWLVSILRRKIIDQHRRKRPHVSFEETLVPALPASNRERLDDVAAVALVHSELASLPNREREAVTLVDVRGLTRDEAAEAMGLTKNALRVLLHRGRHKIRESLEAADVRFD